MSVEAAFPPACVEVSINTDVFRRDGPTPVSLQGSESLCWALVIRVLILSSSIRKHNVDAMHLIAIFV